MCFLKMQIFLIAGIGSEILKIRKIDFVILLFGSIFLCRILPVEITCDFRVASIEFVFIVRTQIRFFAGCKKTSILGKLKLGAITFVQRKNYNLHKWFSLNEACFCHFLIRRCICLKTKSCGIKFFVL